MTERRTHTNDLIGSHGCFHVAAADHNATFYFSSGYGPGKRDGEVWIAIGPVIDLVSKINDFVSSCFILKPP